MPIGMTVGGKDEVVPPGSVIRLAGVLKQLQRNVLLIVRPSGGHSTNYADAKEILEFRYRQGGDRSGAQVNFLLAAGRVCQSGTPQ